MIVVAVTYHCDIWHLFQAANYLNIKSLLDLTCQTVADMIKGKTPEEIRKTFNIKNDFTPEEEEEVRRENQWAFEWRLYHVGLCLTQIYLPDCISVDFVELMAFCILDNSWIWLEEWFDYAVRLLLILVITLCSLIFKFFGLDR